MPTIYAVDRDGHEHELAAPEGAILMEQLRELPDGVAAICGGSCACATCHVYVDPGWLNRLPAAGSDELALLAGASHRRDNSRLSCQISLGPALSGLRVTVAPEE